MSLEKLTWKDQYERITGKKKNLGKNQWELSGPDTEMFSTVNIGEQDIQPHMQIRYRQPTSPTSSSLLIQNMYILNTYRLL